MQLDFALQLEDYEAFQLYKSSRMEKFKKRRRNLWIFVTVVFLALAFYAYEIGETFLMYVLGVLGVVCLFFYPRFYNWSYKRNIRKSIQTGFGDKLGFTETMTIAKDRIHRSSKIGEGSVLISEIENVDETQQHFFLNTSEGTSVVIPKYKIEDPVKLREKLFDLGLDINNDLDWKY